MESSSDLIDLDRALAHRRAMIIQNIYPLHLQMAPFDGMEITPEQGLELFADWDEISIAGGALHTGWERAIMYGAVRPGPTGYTVFASQWSGEYDEHREREIAHKVLGEAGIARKVASVQARNEADALSA